MAQWPGDPGSQGAQVAQVAQAAARHPPPFVARAPTVRLACARTLYHVDYKASCAAHPPLALVGKVLCQLQKPSAISSFLNSCPPHLVAAGNKITLTCLSVSHCPSFLHHTRFPGPNFSTSSVHSGCVVSRVASLNDIWTNSRRWGAFRLCLREVRGRGCVFPGHGLSGHVGPEGSQPQLRLSRFPFSLACQAACVRPGVSHCGPGQL